MKFEYYETTIIFTYNFNGHFNLRVRHEIPETGSQ